MSTNTVVDGTNLVMTFKKANIESQKPGEINLLVEGWINITHSYAIVNCFQLIHLYKNFKDHINFYITEKDYYRKEWNAKKGLMYPKEYNDILSNSNIFKPYTEGLLGNPTIDAVYRITYPYNIVVSEWNREIPVYTFFTSEFSKLDFNYFTVGHPKDTEVTTEYIQKYIGYHPNLKFVSPSKWSQQGMEKLLAATEGTGRTNVVIPHGVDTSIFYKESKQGSRTRLRNFYNVKADEVLLLNIGAMTKNKGIMYILQALNILVNKLEKKQFKLLLKGMEDLYSTKQFLEMYLEELQQGGVLSTLEMNNLLENHIIFTEKTLSFTQLRSLYNAADLYVSPYIAEGFNLCCLEALACGLSILVPRTGSTQEYVNNILNNGGHKHIWYIESQVVESVEGGLQMNNLDTQNLINTIWTHAITLERDSAIDSEKNASYSVMAEYIEKVYSWNAVSRELFDLIKKGRE